MDQRASHWLPLAIALTAGLLILWRMSLSATQRRSSGQLFILFLYKVMRRAWAIVRAIDFGYLEYRRFLQETPIEIENERWLGKLIKSGSDKRAALQRETARPALSLSRNIPE